MIERKVSLTEFQDHTIQRMVGAYGGSVSGVLRYVIQSYFGEHGDEIAARLKRYEEWKAKP